jgi:hypothetical protein
MCVELEQLSQFLGEILGTAPPVDEEEERISFLYGCNNSCVHIGIYPEDVSVRSGTVEIAELVFTFYTPEGKPFNLKPYGEDFIRRAVSYLMEHSTWGSVKIEIFDEELVALVLHRTVLLTEDHLEPFEGDYQKSHFAGELFMLHDEWLQLNEALTVFCSGNDKLSSRDVELLTNSCEGRA